MRQLIRQGKISLDVKEAACHLIADLPQKDRLGELSRLFYFVRDQIRYVWDINDIEELKGAPYLLKIKAGDCDDKCILGCALAESIGYKTRLVAIGPNQRDFVHVYYEVCLDGNWIPCETTENVQFGELPDLSAYSYCKILEN